MKAEHYLNLAPKIPAIKIILNRHMQIPEAKKMPDSG